MMSHGTNLPIHRFIFEAFFATFAAAFAGFFDTAFWLAATFFFAPEFDFCSNASIALLCFPQGKN